MTTPPCTQCKHCKDSIYELNDLYIYCDFEDCWLNEEYAYSDLECDAFEQKLDDNETETSRA